MNEQKSLSLIRGEYLQALQSKRRSLAADLASIDREIAALTNSSISAPVKRKVMGPRSSPVDNPSNVSIFPIIIDHMKKVPGAIHYSKLYQLIVEHGYNFGGKAPSEALYQRMKKDKNGTFAFMGQGMFALSEKGQQGYQGK